MSHILLQQTIYREQQTLQHQARMNNKLVDNISIKLSSESTHRCCDSDGIQHLQARVGQCARVEPVNDGEGPAHSKHQHISDMVEKNLLACLL
jgi:hypothetical protein